MRSSLNRLWLKRRNQIIKPIQFHNMAPVLYTQDISPPARGVLLTAAALGVQLELRTIDLFKKEQRSEEFRKVSA